MKRGTSGIDALIAVNKPCGMTSHDVVSRVRRALGERRVGHAGTLDPDASGVLVVGVGQGTRLMGQLTLDRKSYVGLVAFGAETDTDDAAGSVVRTAEVPAWLADHERAAACVEALVGEHEQVPPAYSAISVDGVRSYARARAGEAVELAARPVTIFGASLIAVQGGAEAPSWLCSFDVSKGCYIRSIARDLGRAQGSAAHLAALQRTSSGVVGMGDCVTIEELDAQGPALVAERSLDPVRALGLPVRVLSDAEAQDVACGRRIARGSFASGEVPGEGGRVSVVHNDRLMGVWESVAGELRCATNFPGGIFGVRS